MTNQELENRIKNLETQLSILASKQSSRDNTNESNISLANQTIIDNKNQACQKESVSVIWDFDETYKINYYVIDDDKLFKCRIDNYGKKPSENPIYWEETNVVVELNRLTKLLNEQ